MDTKSQRQEERDSALSARLRASMAIFNEKEISNATPVNAIFGSVSVLLTMIRVRLLFYHEVFHVHM